MAKLNIEQINAFNSAIANTAAQFQEFERQREQMVAQQRAYERLVASPQEVKISANGPLNELVNTIKAQNEILSKQVDLLKEENERQKEQINAAQAAEEQAHKEAIRSRVFNWVTFGITTAISIAALIISIFVK